MKHYIANLDSRASLKGDRSGGKGASLAWLCRNGFKVPPGFIITAAAFEDFLGDFEIEVLTQRMAWKERDLDRIRDLLLACRIPDSLADPISKAYQKLGGRVAVRSSMVGEDAALTSFAGQLDTILNVTGKEDVLRAVRRCWASMFNWRLVSYLTTHEAGTPEGMLKSFAIAVVVQRMVDAQAAGVAFSSDPLTGQPCVVIEAVRGLGDSLVQGRAEPDRYVVDARGVCTAVKSINPDAPIFEEQYAAKLAQGVRDIASRKQCPQDVEWAWDGDEFHILQSRPITSLVGRRVYSTSMVSEMLPGLIKPLVWSVSTTSKLKNVLGRVFTELIGPNDIDFSRLAKRIHSRVYADNTTLGELHESMGLPANFFEVMSRDARAERRQPLPLTPRTLRTMFRLLCFVWRNSRIADEISDYIERHDRELETYRRAGWTRETSESLLNHVDKLADLYSETMWYNFIGPLNMMFRNQLLERMVKKLAPNVPPSDLVRGLMGLKSLESNRELMSLAAQARTLEAESLSLLSEVDDGTIREKLLETEAGRTLIASVDTFLSRYGFLSASGTDLSRTPWIENPTLIWHAIGRTTANQSEPDAADVTEIREQARTRVRAQLNGVQRFLFDRLLESTVTYIHLREKSSFLISEDSFEMRRIFLALADQMIVRETFQQRDDIFYLSLDEIRQLTAGQLDAQLAREWITSRRAEMISDAEIELPDVICGDHIPTCSIALDDDQEFLTGIAGSSGVARGFARIVLDPAESPASLAHDDILVVPFTDMSWTPLFAGIGGVVAETGGQLSHSAIVAREYGLPAVVNVKNATRLIQDGQPLLVDGTNGRVYLET